MLDNEIVLSEFIPETIACHSLQNSAMQYCPAPPDGAILFRDGHLQLFEKNNGKANVTASLAGTMAI